MAAFLSVCMAMAVSAVYELIEWGVALALGQGADEFLGTQGDVWDTQSDMLFALIGVTLAVTLLRGGMIRNFGSCANRNGGSGLILTVIR